MTGRRFHGLSARMATDSTLPASLAGKLCVVTGATSGIGRFCALELARRGGRVWLTGRDQGRGEAVAAEIRKAGGEADFRAADFSRLAAVRAYAEAVRAAHSHVDILVNNAGLILPERRLTGDGLEETFAVNHLAPFLLTRMLRDVLLAAPAARVVTVSSEAHRVPKALDLALLPRGERFRSFRTYGESKLANVLFTRELTRRFAEAGSKATANCLHPGVVRTGLWRQRRGLLGLLVGLATPFMISEERGGQTLVHAATAPELEGVSGKYLKDMRVVPPSMLSKDAALAAQLWELSEKLADRS